MLLCVFCAPPVSRAEEAIYKETFDTDPVKAGWKCEGAKDADNPWDTAQGAASKPCIKIAGFAPWRSPLFKVGESCKFLRVTFATKAAKVGMWSLGCFDANGQKIFLTLSGTYPSVDWLANEFVAPVAKNTLTACVSRMASSHSGSGIPGDGVRRCGFGSVP